MKLKFLAVDRVPEYEISGESINGVDLSPLGSKDLFVGNKEVYEKGIFDAHRDSTGELYVTLGQSCIGSQYPGLNAHWREGGYIDAADYDPSTPYITLIRTNGITDYEIVWGQGIAAGEEGWTVVKSGGSSE